MAKPSKRFAASQTRLLEAAGEVFAEKGYEAATVREICRRAEVANIAAVNYYFGDKEKLYVAVVKHALGSAEAATPDEVPADLPPRQRLRKAIRRMAEALGGGCRPAWQLQLMGRELACPSPACGWSCATSSSRTIARCCACWTTCCRPRRRRRRGT